MKLSELDRVIALLTRAEQRTVFPERAASAWVNVAEALTLLRQMRENAVEGWAQWVGDENYLFEITDEPTMAQDRAVLIMTPEDA